MREQKAIEKSLLKVRYTLSVPKEYFSDGFRFDKCSLDVIELNIPNLTELNIIDTHEENDRIMMLEAIAEYNIRRDSNRYLEFKQGNESGNPIKPIKFFNSFIKDKMPEFRKLLFNLLQYIAWRKNYHISRGALKYIDIDCYWEIDDTRGDLFSVSDLWEVESVGYYEEEYEKIIPSDFIEFYEMKKKGDDVPTHFELLAEVQRLMYIQSYRTAHLTLYMAFEVATKKFLGKLKPDAEWLITNMPSPDLPKIYREFINDKITVILTEDDLKILKDFTFIRNNIAHKGHTPEAEEVRKYFDYVKKWITLIEYHSGYEWVINNSR